jgi:transcriptional regulator with XRE-family HTH domain
MKNTRAKRQKNISGPQIAAIRKKKGITQLDLAKTVKAQGVKLDRASIAKIENGLRCVLDYELAAIAKGCRVPVSRLLK